MSFCYSTSFRKTGFANLTYKNALLIDLSNKIEKIDIGLET